MRPEFDRASPRAQASRLRHLALEALRQHGIESSRVRLLQHGENTTFRADGERRFVVRVHRFGYRTLAEIESELIFLLGLAEASEVVAPQPHFSTWATESRCWWSSRSWSTSGAAAGMKRWWARSDTSWSAPPPSRSARRELREVLGSWVRVVGRSPLARPPRGRRQRIDQSPATPPSTRS